MPVICAFVCVPVQMYSKQARLINSQLEDLERYLRMKGWDEPNGEARKRVWIAIDRALDKLAEHDGDLADHFRESLLPFSPPYQYQPKVEILWWE